MPAVVVVVGQGYVGLPLAMRAVEVGYKVVGYDTSDDRIKRLLAADSYVEDIPAEVLVAALRSDRYLPTTDNADCVDFDVAVITVPTPLNDGAPDLSYVEQAGQMLAAHLRPGACIVLESTTYPGTTEDLLRPLLERHSGLQAGTDFHLGYSPERIDPGNRRWTFVNTPKIVSGVSEASLAAIETFYKSLVETTVPTNGTGEAELAKLLENTFRHVNIALMNEMAMSARDLGLDLWTALDAASTKPFGFMRFEPGPGVGGHCLPIDPSYLSWQTKRRSGSPFRFVELANDVNNHMPEYVVRRLLLALNTRGKPLNGSRVLLLGLAYKANTGDVRESAAVAVAQRLVRLGSDVIASDPFISATSFSGGVKRTELDAAVVASADAVVLLTDHATFDYQMIAENASYILDTRHRIRGDAVEYL